METSLSPPCPHDVDDGGTDQKRDEEEELGSSGTFDGALKDGSTDRICVDDAAQTENMMRMMLISTNCCEKIAYEVMH
jgi:hypothetical protein